MEFIFNGIDKLVDEMTRPPPTTEQRLERERSALRQRQQEAQHELRKNQLRQQDARQTGRKQLREGAPDSQLKKQAMDILQLEKNEKNLIRERDGLQDTTSQVNRMVNDQVKNRALLNTMAITNQQSVDPEQVRRITVNYMMQKDASKAAKDMMEDALEDSDDELLAEGDGGLAMEDRLRMEEIMGELQQDHSRQILKEIPPPKGVRVQKQTRQESEESRQRLAKFMTGR